MSRILGRRFYGRSTLEVARDLIGATLRFEYRSGLRAGRIVETEAYVGPDDRACHASRGLTPRTRVMFGPPGHAYVYLIYGMHHCLNIVTEVEGYPAAVLIRAVVPLAGIEGQNGNGPGRVGRIFGIDRRLNGADVTKLPLCVHRRSGPEPVVGTGARIGVDYAGAWAKRPWRFFDAAWAAEGPPAGSRSRRS